MDKVDEREPSDAEISAVSDLLKRACNDPIGRTSPYIVSKIIVRKMIAMGWTSPQAASQ